MPEKIFEIKVTNKIHNLWSQRKEERHSWRSDVLASKCGGCVRGVRVSVNECVAGGGRCPAKVARWVINLA